MNVAPGHSTFSGGFAVLTRIAGESKKALDAAGNPAC